METVKEVKLVKPEDFPSLSISDEEFLEFQKTKEISPTVQELSRRFPFDPSLLIFVTQLENIRDKNLIMTPAAKDEARKRVLFYKKALPSSFFKVMEKLFEDLNLLKEEKEENE